MAEHTCFDCGQSLGERSYRRIGHRMQVMVLCESCTARLITDIAQTLGHWLEQDRSQRIAPNAHAPECLSPAATGFRLGVSRRVIYRLIESGELRAIRVGGRLSVPLAAIEDYVAERRGGAA